MDTTQKGRHKQMYQESGDNRQPGEYSAAPQVEPTYTEYAGYGEVGGYTPLPSNSTYQYSSAGQFPTPISSYPSFSTASGNDVEPPATPLSIREGLRQLPSQWWKTIWKPSQTKFLEEKGKASWGLLWIVILTTSVIYGVLQFVQPYIPGSLLNLTSWLSQSSMRYQTPTTSSITELNATIHQIQQWSGIFTGIAFLIGEGIYFLFAKMFKGRGTFLQQVYTNMLYTLPTQLLLGIIFTLPIIGGVLGYLLSMFVGIYLYILRIFSTQAVHRLSIGKALGVVLLPLALWTVLGFVLGFVIVIIIIMNMPMLNN
ncbi:Yip1 family protein [Ktedonospora formicarum]|uniref:Yip1 domain-containing protein n=1 Tax=Ktedonospora formicarum TaxID=2778364 RepID=A0A8J3HT81_9CHLR|nr:Yip1 family protein [Ktedonospora formicarum]GHO43547.1 hypothetical protein KSX_17100 [Ktedonospora formicarum]